MPFLGHLEPSGHEFTVGDTESVLEAALREGLAMPYGCRNGACRSCRGRVLAGEVRYPEGAPKALTQLDRAQGFTLLCQATPASDLRLQVEELEGGRGIVVKTLPVRLAAKRELAHDVVGLELRLPPGERFDFLPGQYVDVLMRDGRRRAFSLAAPPAEDGTLELHVRHVPGGSFSEYVFSALRERAILRIHGPLGSFYLRQELKLPAVLVAGGTGFAPVKAIVEDALARGWEAPMHLYRGARRRRDLYLDALASRWTASHPALTYQAVLSEPAPEDGWAGRTGFVHEAVLQDFPDLSGHVAYMSGPPPMVRAAREAFVARGLDPANVHSDAFDYAYETGHDEVT